MKVGELSAGQIETIDVELDSDGLAMGDEVRLLLPGGVDTFEVIGGGERRPASPSSDATARRVENLRAMNSPRL